MNNATMNHAELTQAMQDVVGNGFEDIEVSDAPNQLIIRQQLSQTSEWIERYGFFAMLKLDAKALKDAFGWKGALPSNAKTLGKMLEKQSGFYRGFEYVSQSVGMVKFMVETCGLEPTELDNYVYDSIRKVKGTMVRLIKVNSDKSIDRANKLLESCGAGGDVKKELALAQGYLENVAPKTKKKNAKRDSAEKAKTEEATGLTPEQLEKASKAIGENAIALAFDGLSVESLERLAVKLNGVIQAKKLQAKADKMQGAKKAESKTGRLKVK